MTALVPVALVVCTVVGIGLMVWWWRPDRAGSAIEGATVARRRQRLVADTLIYVLGANVAFLAQEVALVGAEAALPGVSATLFHNSHDWTGDHPALELALGAGALGMAVAAVAGWLVARTATPGRFAHRAGWWTAFHGLVGFSLSVATGVIDGETETGRALDALGLDGSAATLLGVLAVLAVPVIGLQLGPRLRGDAAMGETPGALARRQLFLPALLAVPVLAAFRAPDASQAVAGVLLAVIAVPWVVVGATTEHGERHRPAVDDDGQLDGPVWSTVASTLVAVALVPGITVG